MNSIPSLTILDCLEKGATLSTLPTAVYRFGYFRVDKKKAFKEDAYP